MTQETLDTAPQIQTLQDVGKWIGYSSCDDLPLSIFIDCLIKQEYRKLIISGEPTEEELAELWLRLYSEYHELSGNSSMNAIISQMWERDTKITKINSVKLLLSQLAQRPDETLAAIVRLWGFHLPSFEGDEDVYAAHINRITAQLKGLTHEVKKAQEILDGLKGDTATKSSFTRQLRQVSKHFQFHLDERILTVTQYCEYVRDFREYCESVNNKPVPDAAGY